MEISDYTKPLTNNSSYIQKLEYSFYHVIDSIIQQVDNKIKNVTMFIPNRYSTGTITPSIVLSNHIITHYSDKTIFPSVSNFQLEFYGCDKEDIGNILDKIQTGTSYCSEWKVLRVDLSRQQETEPITIAYIEAVTPI